jgi:hypothetical protein
MRVIAANPAVFVDIHADAAKLGGQFAEKIRLLIVKQIKAKNSSVVSIRAIADALGPAAFDGAVDTLKASELKTLVGRLDRHHPEQKTASAEWRRKHFRSLIAGSSEPATKPAPKAKAAAKRASKPKKQKLSTPKVLEEDVYLDEPSAGAVRKR